MCRTKHYSPRTEESYTRRIERFLRFHREAAGLGGGVCSSPHVPCKLHPTTSACGQGPAQTSLLSAGRAGSEGHARELPRWLGAEPLPQEHEIGYLSLGELVACVSAELHPDAEAADGDAGNRAFAREVLGAKGPSLRAARRMPALRAFSLAVRRANGRRHSAVLFPSWDRVRVREVRYGKSLPGTASVLKWHGFGAIRLAWPMLRRPFTPTSSTMKIGHDKRHSLGTCREALIHGHGLATPGDPAAGCPDYRVPKSCSRSS